MNCAEKIKMMFQGQKAVLKHAQSKRWRDCRTIPNFAKRLECGRFTAAVLGNVFLPRELMSVGWSHAD